jgi:hypothetical protein
MMRGCATGSACDAIDAAAITIETRHEYLMSFQQVVVGCVLAVALTACHTSSPPLSNTVDLKIIAFNDFHGNFFAPGKLAGDSTAPAVIRLIRCES